MEPDRVAENYRYWQENGRGWAEEYDRRKRVQLYYHIEEAMLADYMARQAPARVLEFGCGVGRHLRYLRQLDGIEIHGYDQSPTMVEAISQWADPEWIKERVRVGGPLGPLPYADKSFDIVYTAEVLVHVRPQDLLTILRELRRVSKWQIFHIETAPDFGLVSDEHNGCWFHDLIGAYRELGLPCEVLAQGYDEHRPYRVMLDSSRAAGTPPETVMRLLRRAQHDLQPILQEKLSLEGELEASRAQAQAGIAALERERVQAQAAVARLEADRSALQTRGERLAADLSIERQRNATLAREVEANDAAIIRWRRDYAGLEYQLEEVKRSRSYRLTNAINRSRLMATIRRRPTLVIRALGTQHAEASGCEVRILGVRTSESPSGVPLGAIRANVAVWQSMKDPHAPAGESLVSKKSGKAVLPVSRNSELRVDLQMNEGAGRVSIEVAGRATIVDLFSKVPQRISVYPCRETNRITSWTS